MIETGILLNRITTVNTSVLKASRLIYTGQAPSPEVLRTEICGKLSLISDCENNIFIELSPLNGFLDRPMDDVQCRDSADMDFMPVDRFAAVRAAEVAILRVCVTTDIVTPGLGIGLALARTDTGRFQITSSTAFFSEPF